MFSDTYLNLPQEVHLPRVCHITDDSPAVPASQSSHPSRTMDVVRHKTGEVEVNHTLYLKQSEIRGSVEILSLGQTYDPGVEGGGVRGANLDTYSFLILT